MIIARKLSEAAKEKSIRDRSEWEMDDPDIQYDSDDSLELSDADFKTGEYAKRIQGTHLHYTNKK